MNAAASSTCVILVNWNGWRDSIECIASLLQLRPLPMSIVWVDNASTDGSLEQLARWCAGQAATDVASPIAGVTPLPRAPAGLGWAERAAERAAESAPAAALPQVLLVRSDRNAGFAGGNNIGMGLAWQAGAQACWLLNTDTVVAPDALQALLRRAGQRPDAGAVGSSLIYYWRPHLVQAWGGAAYHPHTGGAQHLGDGTPADAIPADPSAVEAQTSYVVGASMLVGREFVQQVGPMCEDYFLYYEEIDWAERGRRAGFGLAWAPDSRVFHKVGGSSRRRASRASLRFLYRNRLTVTRKFFAAHRGAALRAMFRQMVHHALRGHWDDVAELGGAVWDAWRHRRGAL